MKHKLKTQTSLFLGLVVALSLTACSESADSTTTDSTPSQSTESQESTDTTPETASTSSNQEDFFWQIGIIGAERTTDLSNTQSFTLYGGDIEDVDYSATASDGHEFLILELSIDKAGAGGNPFDWADLRVEDSEGNAYTRMENDKFLEDYNLPRLNGTALTLGGNEGFICIEVPSSSGDLSLIHQTDEGENKIPITLLS